MNYSRFRMAMARSRHQQRLDEGEGHYEDCPWATDMRDCDCNQRAEAEYLESLWEDRRG